MNLHLLGIIFNLKMTFSYLVITVQSVISKVKGILNYNSSKAFSFLHKTFKKKCLKRENQPLKQAITLFQKPNFNLVELYTILSMTSSFKNYIEILCNAKKTLLDNRITWVFLTQSQSHSHSWVDNLMKAKTVRKSLNLREKEF